MKIIKCSVYTIIFSNILNLLNLQGSIHFRTNNFSCVEKQNKDILSSSLTTFMQERKMLLISSTKQTLKKLVGPRTFQDPFIYISRFYEKFFFLLKIRNGFLNI